MAVCGLAGSSAVGSGVLCVWEWWSTWWLAQRSGAGVPRAVALLTHHPHPLPTHIPPSLCRQANAAHPPRHPLPAGRHPPWGRARPSPRSSAADLTASQPPTPTHPPRRQHPFCPGRDRQPESPPHTLPSHPHPPTHAPSPSPQAGTAFIQGVIASLEASHQPDTEQPILYLRMQIAQYQLLQGELGEAKKTLDAGREVLEGLEDVSVGQDGGRAGAVGWGVGRGGSWGRLRRPWTRGGRRWRAWRTRVGGAGWGEGGGGAAAGWGQQGGEEVGCWSLGRCEQWQSAPWPLFLPGLSLRGAGPHRGWGAGGGKPTLDAGTTHPPSTPLPHPYTHPPTLDPPVLLQVDPQVSASVYYVGTLYHTQQKEYAAFYRSALLYLAFVSQDTLPQDFRMVSGRGGGGGGGSVGWLGVCGGAWRPCPCQGTLGWLGVCVGEYWLVGCVRGHAAAAAAAAAVHGPRQPGRPPCPARHPHPPAPPPPSPHPQAMAVDISLAALLGEDVYSFGELLLHPIVSRCSVHSSGELLLLHPIASQHHGCRHPPAYQGLGCWWFVCGLGPAEGGGAVYACHAQLQRAAAAAAAAAPCVEDGLRLA